MNDLPDCFSTLVDRFDPSVFDAPAGQARIRVVIAEEGAVGRARRCRRRPGCRRRAEPDSRRDAERRSPHLGTHRRGSARRDGRLSSRAAGRSPQPPPGGRFPRGHQRGHRPPAAAIPAHRDGLGSALDPDGRCRGDGPADPRPRSDEGLVLAHRRRAGGLVPHDRARPARLRRFVQASGRTLSRAVLRALCRGVDGYAGDRSCAHDRQQHGRARRAGAGPATPRARGTSGAAGTVTGVAT